ncbi:MAG: hypothetical protein EOO73_22165 [Myxococcales bacterium]|nr:MAG: hypothetical protein EOO73_22165 [Myxococcales bacterium]
MDAAYSYRETLLASTRVSWRLEDVLAPSDRLDFSAPFLPESLAHTASLAALSSAERLTLNQLRGYSYLRLFGLVEEFILPFVLDHARSRVDAEDAEVRALLQFASEEAKHIELFKRFAAAFREDFRTPVEVIGPARDIADAVLEHSQLGVALAVLHIEWMTQQHYVEAVKSASLEPLFKRLLHHHWLEEAQHAKLDTLIAHKVAEPLGSAEIQQGIADYQRIVRLLGSGLDRQAELDLEALSRASGRDFPREAQAEILAAQRRSYHRTFIDAGREHPKFRRTVAQISRA